MNLSTICKILALSVVVLTSGCGDSNVLLRFDDGSPKVVGQYDAEGKQDGEFQYYYPNGQLKQESHWKSGVQEGKAKSYFENGQLAVESDWSNGVLNGKRTSYYENGQLSVEATYVDGVVEGELLEYFPNGKLKKKAIWKNGEESNIQYFDENGEEL